MWRAVMAPSSRDKRETVHFPPTKSSPADMPPAEDSGHCRNDDRPNCRVKSE